MKTTICIPCYGEHYKYCQELVDAYHSQTILQNFDEKDRNSFSCLYKSSSLVLNIFSYSFR